MLRKEQQWRVKAGNIDSVPSVSAFFFSLFLSELSE
jgi:hypothetical protein